MEGVVSDIDWDAIRDELLDMEYEEEDNDEYTMEDYYGQSDPFLRMQEEPHIPSNLLKVGANIEDTESDEDGIDKNGYVTEEDIEKYAGIIYPEKKVYRSLLLEIFTVDQCIEIEKIARSFSITNNQKVEMYKQKFDSWGLEYNPLGPGTNRFAFSVDGYCIKVACDADGKIDNQREFKYSMKLQPYVIKAYETYSSGLFAVFEYVEAFSLDDFWKSQEEMREILTDIASTYLIGDVGVTTTNYGNWGYRNDGSLVILDFAYIYSVEFKRFSCNCSPEASLYYDKDFNNLICPLCGKKYTFTDIRKKISRKDQAIEIGDLDEQGIIITQAEEEKAFHPKFVYGATDRVRKALLKKKKKENEKIKRTHRNQEYSEEDAPLSLEEIMAKIENNEWRI